MAERPICLRALLSYGNRSIKVCHVRDFSLSLSLQPTLAHEADKEMACVRLAFYYRIFPILQFRRLLVWIGVFTLIYLLTVNLAIVFQWCVAFTLRDYYAS